MDNVVIKDNCTVVNSFIDDGCTIEEKCVIENGTMIASNVVVEAGSQLKGNILESTEVERGRSHLSLVYALVWIEYILFLSKN